MALYRGKLIESMPVFITLMRRMIPAQNLRRASMLAFLAFAISLAPRPGRAEFELFDNFESYSQGDINGKGGWVSFRNVYSTSALQNVVTTDPSQPGNQVLHHIDGYSGLYNATAGIPQGSTATVFLRFSYDSALYNDTVFGLSDVPTPDSTTNLFYDFEAQVGLYDAGTLRLRDGIVRGSSTAGSFGPSAAGLENATTKLNTRTWYNLWMVVDNSADTIRLYLQSDQDSDFFIQTIFQSSDGAINFRNGLANNDLSTILIRTYSPSAAPSVYFDDLYIDRSGANLSNPIPVPEASTLMLLAVAVFGAITIRFQQGRGSMRVGPPI